MEFKFIVERLKSKLSKAEILALANEIITEKHDFSELFSFLKEDTPRSMRTAWLLENVIIPNKKLQATYFDAFVKAYLKTQSSSVRRVVGKIIANCNITQKWEDQLYSFCTNMIVDSKEVVAAKTHAMLIAARIAANYPELINELRQTIEGEFDKNTVAFSAAAKRAFKLFKKAGY